MLTGYTLLHDVHVHLSENLSESWVVFKPLEGLGFDVQVHPWCILRCQER